MTDNQLIKELESDDALHNMLYCLASADGISEQEISERGILLISFWIENRRKYYRLCEAVQEGNHTPENVIDFVCLLRSFKAICDGKELTYAMLENCDTTDLEEIINVINCGSKENLPPCGN